MKFIFFQIGECYFRRLPYVGAPPAEYSIREEGSIIPSIRKEYESSTPSYALLVFKCSKIIIYVSGIRTLYIAK